MGFFKRCVAAMRGTYKPANELISTAAVSAYAKPNGHVGLPWLVAGLGVESKILLGLADKFGAMGVATKGSGTNRKYKFYYSSKSAGSWFTEVWSMWKVAAWFTAVLYFGTGFQELKSGAGCALVGTLGLLAFGPRAVLAMMNSVVAAKLSGYAYAREAFPMMAAGALGSVMLLEWAWVLPWNGGLLIETVKGLLGYLFVYNGLGGAVVSAVKSGIAVAVCALVSFLVYSAVSGGMMSKWLLEAERVGLLFAAPEPGTWFYKMMTSGPNKYSGSYTFLLVVAAVGGIVAPFL